MTLLELVVDRHALAKLCELSVTNGFGVVVLDMLICLQNYHRGKKLAKLIIFKFLLV